MSNLATRVAAATRSTGTVAFGVRLSADVGVSRRGWYEFTPTGAWRWLGANSAEILATA